MSKTRDEKISETPYEKTAAKIIEILATLKLSDDEDIINLASVIKHNLLNCTSTKKTDQTKYLIDSFALLTAAEEETSSIIEEGKAITALLINNPLNLGSKELIELFDLSIKEHHEPLQRITLEIIVRQLFNRESCDEMNKAIDNINNPSRLAMKRALRKRFKSDYFQLQGSSKDLFDHLENKLADTDYDHTLIDMQIAALDRELKTLAFPENFNHKKSNYNDYRERLLAAHDSLTMPRVEQKGKTDLQIIKSSRHPTWRAFVKILENLFSYFKMKKESVESRGHHKFWKPRGYDHAHKAKTMRKELGIKGHGK